MSQVMKSRDRRGLERKSGRAGNKRKQSDGRLNYSTVKEIKDRRVV